MTADESVKQALKQHKSSIKDRYHVKRIGIFGSYARGHQKKKSDIDILVEFSRPVGFFTFLELEDYLSEKLGSKIDLVSKNALRPAIGKNILNEVSFV